MQCLGNLAVISHPQPILRMSRHTIIGGHQVQHAGAVVHELNFDVPT